MVLARFRSRFNRDGSVNIKDSVTQGAPSVKIRRHPRRAEYNAAKSGGPARVKRARRRDPTNYFSRRDPLLRGETVSELVRLISSLSVPWKAHFLSTAR